VANIFRISEELDTDDASFSMDEEAADFMGMGTCPLALEPHSPPEQDTSRTSDFMGMGNSRLALDHSGQDTSHTSDFMGMGNSRLALESIEPAAVLARCLCCEDGESICEGASVGKSLVGVGWSVLAALTTGHQPAIY